MAIRLRFDYQDYTFAYFFYVTENQMSKYNKLWQRPRLAAELAFSALSKLISMRHESMNERVNL